MAPHAPYFDLLDDGMVQQVIQRIRTNNGAGCWHNLAATCRSMCTRLRRSRRVRWCAPPEGVLHLVKVPPHRAFSHVYACHFESTEKKEQDQGVLFVDAVRAAVAAWPQLEEVAITRGGLTFSNHTSASPLRALYAAAALRRLQLDLPDPNALFHLPGLTQLTHLALSGIGSNPIGDMVIDSQPLDGMPHLVSLQLQGLAPAPGMSWALPPNITRLELQSGYSASMWLDHILRCQELRELHLWSPVHPVHMLDALAEHLQHLVKLSVPRLKTADIYLGDDMLSYMVPCLLTRAGIAAEEQQEAWQVTPPLGPAQGIGWPAYYVVVPPPNMGRLAALQHLELDGWWLVLSGCGYWRALAACCHLVTLPDLHVSAPPPAGVTFPGVTRLDVTVSTSPGDTLAVLAAFPALQQLQLKVVPGSDADQQPQGAPSQVVLDHITSASLAFLQPPPDLPPAAAAACLAAYCSTMWGALPGLQQLALEWPNTVALLPLLPAVSTLQQLRGLQLDSSCARAAISCGGAAVVEPQQVVELVHGSGQLAALTVAVDLAPGSSKGQLVLGLAGALPGLRRLVVLKRGERLAPATLAGLRGWWCADGAEL